MSKKFDPFPPQKFKSRTFKAKKFKARQFNSPQYRQPQPSALRSYRRGMGEFRMSLAETRATGREIKETGKAVYGTGKAVGKAGYGVGRFVVTGGKRVAGAIGRRLFKKKSLYGRQGTSKLPEPKMAEPSGNGKL